MRWILIGAALALVGFAAMAAPPPDSDGAYAPWYQQLTVPGSGASCCSISDCRKVDYRTGATGYEVMLDGAWQIVPAGAVLRGEQNPTGFGVVCATPWNGIICFVTAVEG